MSIQTLLESNISTLLLEQVLYESVLDACKREGDIMIDALTEYITNLDKYIGTKDEEMLSEALYPYLNKNSFLYETFLFEDRDDEAALAAEEARRKLKKGGSTTTPPLTKAQLDAKARRDAAIKSMKDAEESSHSSQQPSSIGSTTTPPPPKGGSTPSLKSIGHDIAELYRNKIGNKPYVKAITKGIKSAKDWVVEKAKQKSINPRIGFHGIMAKRYMDKIEKQKEIRKNIDNDTKYTGEMKKDRLRRVDQKINKLESKHQKHEDRIKSLSSQRK